MQKVVLFKRKIHEIFSYSYKDLCYYYYFILFFFTFKLASIEFDILVYMFLYVTYNNPMF